MMQIRLRELRESRGLRVSQMIERLGVQDSRYRKWESNSAQIPLEYACMCADILKCSLDELAGRRVPSKPSIDSAEQHVIDCYRSTDARGKAAITRTAEGEAGVEGQSEGNRRAM